MQKRNIRVPGNTADGSIAFRLDAPGANRAQVQPGAMDSGLGSEPREMVRDAEGVWTVALPPGASCP